MFWASPALAEGLLLQAGDAATMSYDLPIPELRAQADNGDAEAQFLLGVHLLMGDGAAADTIAARNLIRLSAQQGHAIAQLWLGRLAEEGIGGEKAPIQAYKWYRRAAAQGETAQVSVPSTAPVLLITDSDLAKDIVKEQAAAGVGAATGLKIRMQLVSLSPWAGDRAARLARRLVLGDVQGAPSLEGPRVALVAGNSEYKNAPDLPNAVNDALAVGALLETLNFDVVYAIDVPKTALVSLLDEFADKANGAAVSFFYYAGHGVQVNGLNYLIPPEMDAASGKPLADSAIGLEDIVELMQSRTKVSIVMLDACRDNPYLDSALTASIGAARPRKRGFAAMDPVNTSTYIAFATAPGQVASDGANGNSPFAAALVKHLPTPGLEIDQAMRRVKREVKAATRQQQSPWTMGDLDVEVYLAADK